MLIVSTSDSMNNLNVNFLCVEPAGVCYKWKFEWLNAYVFVTKLCSHGNSDATSSFEKVHYTDTLEISLLIQDETFFIPPFTSPLI